MALVIFDVDGTLVNSGDLIVAGIEHAFKTCNVPIPTPARSRSIIGLSIDKAVARLAPDHTDSITIQNLADHYVSFFQNGLYKGDPEILFDGCLNVIQELYQGKYRLGVATGKSLVGVHRSFKELGLTDYFHTIQTACRHPSKPHPSMILEAMQDEGKEKHQTIMVGDTSFDMEMAKSAGVTAIGVAWGYHSLDELHRAGADYIVHSFGECLDVIKRVL